MKNIDIVKLTKIARQIIGEDISTVCRFPHALLLQDSEVLRTIARVTGDPITCWGEFPPINAAGVPSANLFDNAWYTAWNNPACQELLLRSLGHAALGHVTCYFRADLGNEDIHEIEAHLFQSLTPDVNPGVWDILRVMIHFIDRLRWLYIPLSDEEDVGLCVFAVSAAREAKECELIWIQSEVYLGKL